MITIMISVMRAAGGGRAQPSDVQVERNLQHLLQTFSCIICFEFVLSVFFVLCLFHYVALLIASHLAVSRTKTPHPFIHTSIHPYDRVEDSSNVSWTPSKIGQNGHSPASAAPPYRYTYFMQEYCHIDLSLFY